MLATFAPRAVRLRACGAAPLSRGLTYALLVALLVTAVPPLARFSDRALPSTQGAQTTQSIPTTDATPLTGAPAPATAQTLPPGLGPVLNATLAADAGGNYAPVALPGAVVRADNPRQQFSTTFDRDGAHLAATGGAASALFSLHAVEIAAPEGNVPLPAADPVIAGGRVEYRRGAVTEWYVNAPQGMEQGFTLAAAPAGGAQFTLRLAVTGDAPMGDAAALHIGALRYTDLAVTDAAGAVLPARLAVVNGAIEIAVDATAAVWPVTVDPLITRAGLNAPDPATATSFGASVAIATAGGLNTVVVGANNQ